MNEKFCLFIALHSTK